MTNLRTAAQQALEALEWSWGGEPIGTLERDAIAALKAALAEPVQPVASFDEVWDAIDWDEWRSQPIRELVRMIHSKTDPKAALAEPVQEPVAKVELMTTGGNVGLATRIVEIDDHLRERLRPGQLLYTAPPQRQPLTDDAYRQLMKHAHRLANDGHGELAQYLRDAIDIAHGIGSKDE